MTCYIHWLNSLIKYICQYYICGGFIYIIILVVMMSTSRKYSTAGNIQTVKSIYEAALSSVQPTQMVKNNLHLQEDTKLVVGWLFL